MQWILLLLVIKSCSVGVCALAGSVPVETEPRQVSDPQEAVGHNRPSWQIYRGKPGPTGWRCHVIWPDPKDHGPDGINIHDWDNDGHLDVFVNYEEGHYSRLYFNPGEHIRRTWPDYVEFRHGNCEDSTIGDLDNDGYVDYVANGGWVYFNPGPDRVRDARAWIKMTLFDREERTPIVADVDGDGLNDLIVGGHRWYKQPATGKHVASNWQSFSIGKNRWAMNCILHDLDGDGELDWIVPDRFVETCWYANPGKGEADGKWVRKMLHKHKYPMFAALKDVNNDGLDDIVIAGGLRGRYKEKLIILIRSSKQDLAFDEVVIDQPCGNFPKGVAITDLDGNPETCEIVVVPKQGDLWRANFTGNAQKATNWSTEPIRVPGAETRIKMDNAYIADIDDDGDLDILTTEENGGWGVIWFENPDVSGVIKQMPMIKSKRLERLSAR